MKAHARVVVVGGGCVGASILYNLTKRGWNDVVMLERTQLTAGSTWHAAGLVPSYTRSSSVGRMLAHTFEVYREVERVSGQSVGWHKSGQLRVANTRERMDEYLSYMSVAEAQGATAEMFSPARIRELWPLLDGNKQMLGGLYHPDDGHIAPADITQAMAKAARDRGATIYLNTEATGFEKLPNGEWAIVTNQGRITCEHLVLATGNYARQTGAMLGLDIPAIPIVHQYWITEEVPAIAKRHKAGLPEMPILRDEAFTGYLREEGTGLMFGPYERPEHLKIFAEDGVPAWFGADLLPEDFDAVADNWVAATEVVPVLGSTGIKRNVRGPFQMTPDELPLAGPAWGLNNVWLAEGVPGGIQWGGALGHILSDWITEGDPGIDTAAIDARRFSDYTNRPWTMVKVREAWGTHADIRYPGEDLPAARPQKTAPSYRRLSELGAVWGVVNGWEVPRWYAANPGTKNDYSYRQSKHFDRIGQEVKAVRQAVGLVEMTAMSKFEVTGPNAATWLDSIVANRLPKVGRVGLCHQLTERGGVQAEYTITRLDEDYFYLVCTPRAERMNYDLLARSMPKDGTVHLRNVTMERGCFTVVGPSARDLLQEVADLDLSNGAFPWMAARTGVVGYASDVRLLRINYEGELGWELFHPIGYQEHLLETILHAGQKHGLELIGFEALESLRLDKSYRAFYRDMNMEYSALESGLERFVRINDKEFVGRSALMKQMSNGIPRQLVTLSFEQNDGSVSSDEGIYLDGNLVGQITSGGYSHHFEHDLALGLIRSDLVHHGQELNVQVLGEWRTATVIPESPYDADSQRPRM